MDDQQYIMISALEHYSYCPRQCGLIHVERIYDENLFTLRGNRLHERADKRSTRFENGVRVERALPVWSDELGLSGTADIVEFHADGTITPVEYKPGKRPVTIHDDIQLCAQALCLEEMFGTRVVVGDLFSGETKRRREVYFDDGLREATKDLIVAVRTMINTYEPLPAALNDKRCPNCSLREACMPETVVAARRIPIGRIFVPTREEAIKGDG